MNWTNFIRNWFPCFRQEHDWYEPAYAHRPDYLGGGYKIEGKRCARCKKFVGKWIVEISPPSCPKCGSRSGRAGSM